MDNKYGETQQQKLERALNQVVPNANNIVSQSGNAKQVSNEEIVSAVHSIFYNGLQSAIAKEFIDEFNKNGPLKLDQNRLNEIANTAAKNFLDSLCSQGSH